MYEMFKPTDEQDLTNFIKFNSSKNAAVDPDEIDYSKIYTTEETCQYCMATQGLTKKDWWCKTYCGYNPERKI